MSLAVKYRPQVFEDVCGQTITTTILKKVLEKREFKNCYLFCGTSGTGKTTCARIFANQINRGIGAPIEIDAASNGSVESIRAIVDSANERALAGEYKIYIIDECHSVSTTGWQAFLKCIEEAPKYTIFIFCTTEVQKVPKTILNRVQRYNFAPIKAASIYSRLEYICQQEGYTNYNQACEFISKICFGGMRDAIVALEQCADYSTDLSMENVKNVLGALSYETMFKLTWALQKNDEQGILAIIEELYTAGSDLKVFIDNYLNFVLDLLKFIILQDITITGIPAYLASADNAVVQYTVQPENSKAYFKALTEKLLELKGLIKLDTACKSTIEVVLLQFSRSM